jgi:hypothetical protein
MPSSEYLGGLFRVLVYASIGLTVLQIYLTLNKLWKRKHEKVVAESVSILGEFVGLIPLAILTANFGFEQQWEGLIDGLLWIFAASVTVLIGTGVWVKGQRRQGFGSLLRAAIRAERDEVGYLARSFFRPSGAARILEILGKVALLDDTLDERERGFIQSFADTWGVEFSWARFESGGAAQGRDLIGLQASVEAYLATSPPDQQVRQLGDVMHALVRIDDDVSHDEALMMSELQGMFDAYLGEADARWGVVLVPQSDEQDEAIRGLVPGVEPREIRGGRAYLVGRHHSRDYAEVVGRRYEALNVFSAVVPVDG